jgi:ATP-dependent DNA helicase PIF1
MSSCCNAINIVIFPVFQFDAAQQHALTTVTDGHNLVIQGSPGTGKSTVIHMAVQALEAMGRKVAVTASTGIAAVNLTTPQLKASTIHRYTGLQT